MREVLLSSRSKLRSNPLSVESTRRSRVTSGLSKTTSFSSMNCVLITRLWSVPFAVVYVTRSMLLVPQFLHQAPPSSFLWLNASVHSERIDFPSYFLASSWFVVCLCANLAANGKSSLWNHCWSFVGLWRGERTCWWRSNDHVPLLFVPLLDNSPSGMYQ